MEYRTVSLTREERLALIRFAVMHATRLECHTENVIHRQLKIEDLENAFLEYENRFKDKFEILNELHDDLVSKESMLKDGASTIELFKIMHQQIVENIDTTNIRDYYTIIVDNEISSELKKIHASMNPVVAFGYTNALLESCKKDITLEFRDILLDAFDSEELYTEGYGDFYINDPEDDGDENSNGLAYMNLRLYIGDRMLISTVSHMQDFEVIFSDEEFEMLKTFESEFKRNEVIIKKLSGTYEEEMLEEESENLN